MNYRKITLLVFLGIIVLAALNNRFAAYSAAAVFLAWFLLSWYGIFNIKSQFIGKTYWRGNGSKKEIALTFDDGPHEPYTTQILDILKKYNIKATFFLVGKNIEKHPEIVKQIWEEGHAIGNHTYNHRRFFYTLFPAIREDILKCQGLIKNITGINTSLFRQPLGMRNPSIVKMVEDLNMHMIGWTLRTYDGTDQNPQRIVKRALNRITNGAILVMHDGCDKGRCAKSGTVAALPIILDALTKDGYKFVTVSELLGINPVILDAPLTLPSPLGGEDKGEGVRRLHR
ncbi:MAG: polysaccharide deacetylase family protein [Nitrospirota bacterium]